MSDVIFVRLMQSLSMDYGILKVPAAICPLPVWNQLRPRPRLFLLLLLNILGIKYSMYDVIFVKLKQNLSAVFGKYQLQHANFRSGTSLDHAHFYF